MRGEGVTGRRKAPLSSQLARFKSKARLIEMLTPFRLATFNLENLDCASAHNRAFERRLGVLKPILSELAADVLCLQEIDAQKAADHDGRRFLALDRTLCRRTV